MANGLSTSAAFAGLPDRIVERQQQSQQQSAIGRGGSERQGGQRVHLVRRRLGCCRCNLSKRWGSPIEKANKGVGEITTEFQIAQPKKPKQSGMRYVVDLRKFPLRNPVCRSLASNRRVQCPGARFVGCTEVQSRRVRVDHEGIQTQRQRTKAGAGCEL